MQRFDGGQIDNGQQFADGRNWGVSAQCFDCPGKCWKSMFRAGNRLDPAGHVPATPGFFDLVHNLISAIFDR